MRLAALFLLAASVARGQQYRAFWVDAFNRGFKSPAEIEELVENAVTARANAIFMQARRRGDVYYLKANEPPAEDASYNPNFDALDYLIGRAHAKGLEVHAWFVISRLWTSPAPPRDPRHLWHSHGPSAQGADNWMTVSSTGVMSTASIDLGHPGVTQYLADVVIEAARNYDLDGVHLDYIRYPEDADYGWNPKAVERYGRLGNRVGTPVRNDPAWSEFRRTQVTQLVRQIYLRAAALKPRLKVSAALITWGGGPASDAGFRTLDAYARVFQDWRGWLEEGILDIGMPMNYFAETPNGPLLDRWLAYEKDRQYSRALLVGLGVYLNPIADSLQQIERALAATPAGNAPWGLAFYSYATTNAGRPAAPNGDFYRAVAGYFREPAAPPGLPWKNNPAKGHVYGWVRVDGGPEWLRDGATVWVESDSGGLARELITDGTGFFGAVDLPPDRYRVRVERGGRELFRTAAQDVRAGQAAPFEMFFRAADFDAAVPRIEAASGPRAAPGDIVAFTGRALAARDGWATEVPLPASIDGTQVVVNGDVAPLFESAPGKLTVQMPYRSASNWTVMVRHKGLESAPFELAYTPANPLVLGARSLGGGWIEIHATGLGLLDRSVAAGAGGSAEEPFPRVALPVRVLVRTAGGETVVEPAYAGLTPYYPARYQVNVRLPAPAAGEVLLDVGGIRSNAVPLP